MPEKVCIYVEEDEIIVEDALRDRVQFNSFEDLIGYKIEWVEENKDGETILTLRKIDETKT